MQMLWIRGILWLATELFLTLVELDNLADYSEFIFRLKDDLALQRDRIEQVLCADGIDYPVCVRQPAPVLAGAVTPWLPTVC